MSREPVKVRGREGFGHPNRVLSPRWPHSIKEIRGKPFRDLCDLAFIAQALRARYEQEVRSDASISSASGITPSKRTLRGLHENEKRCEVDGADHDDIGKK